MTGQRKPTAPLWHLGELAEAAGILEPVAERLLDRAGIPPAERGGGRGVRKRWLATDAIVLRVLARLAAQGCPDVWLAAVAAWWARVDPDAVAGRVVIVAPTREPVVFATTRSNAGHLLNGHDGWLVDLGRPVATPQGRR